MGGSVGEVAQGGRARGEMGGAPESSVGATKGGLVPPFARGEMGGGGTRE